MIGRVSLGCQTRSQQFGLLIQPIPVALRRLSKVCHRFTQSAKIIIRNSSDSIFIRPGLGNQVRKNGPKSRIRRSPRSEYSERVRSRLNLQDQRTARGGMTRTLPYDPEGRTPSGKMIVTRCPAWRHLPKDETSRLDRARALGEPVTEVEIR